MRGKINSSSSHFAVPLLCFFNTASWYCELGAARWGSDGWMDGYGLADRDRQAYSIKNSYIHIHIYTAHHTTPCTKQPFPRDCMYACIRELGTPYACYDFGRLS